MLFVDRLRSLESELALNESRFRRQLPRRKCQRMKAKLKTSFVCASVVGYFLARS